MINVTKHLDPENLGIHALKLHLLQCSPLSVVHRKKKGKRNGVA